MVDPLVSCKCSLSPVTIVVHELGSFWGPIVRPSSNNLPLYHKLHILVPDFDPQGTLQSHNHALKICLREVHYIQNLAALEK